MAGLLAKLIPRYSLRTLMLFVMLAGCVIALWMHRHPWRSERVLSGHKDRVFSAVFPPDGRRVVTASLDKTARIWDPATGRELFKLAGHENAVLSAAFSPDGSRVVTARSDTTARVWRPARPE